MEDIANELIQLENNLQFFSSNSDDNPMLKEVNKIEQLNQQKTALEEKANAIKSLKRALNKQHQAQEEEQEQEKKRLRSKINLKENYDCLFASSQ